MYPFYSVVHLKCIVVYILSLLHIRKLSYSLTGGKR